MTLEELRPTEEERGVLQLWELWQDEMIADSTDRSQKLVVAYYKEHGLDIMEKSPLALMFTGFLGGVQSILDALGDAGEGAETH